MIHVGWLCVAAFVCFAAGYYSNRRSKYIGDPLFAVIRAVYNRTTQKSDLELVGCFLSEENADKTVALEKKLGCEDDEELGLFTVETVLEE